VDKSDDDIQFRWRSYSQRDRNTMEKTGRLIVKFGYKKVTLTELMDNFEKKKEKSDGKDK